eukprot:TRINITY_DN11340_c1_g1_i9.p1 TRINITY_DN11340_c1_g1~~TRINITY_DN11340_c1_g1_i9.p1  ORF type:complete len:972 (+),score=185.91 TRINITY_DN11340_c1_g1_i9:421-2916(+)
MAALGSLSLCGSASPHDGINLESLEEEEEARIVAQQRLRAARQTTRDMEHLLQDCSSSVRSRSRSPQRRSLEEDGCLEQEHDTAGDGTGHLSPERCSSIADGSASAKCDDDASSPAHAGAEDDEDNDIFQDCEEFKLLELPAAADIRGGGAGNPWERFEQGVLKRSAFRLNSISIELIGEHGSVHLGMKGIEFSIDKRTSLTRWQAKCYRALYGLSEPTETGAPISPCPPPTPTAQAQESPANPTPPSSARTDPSEVPPLPAPAMPCRSTGILYAGVALTSTQLLFAPAPQSASGVSLAKSRKSVGTPTVNTAEWVEVLRLGSRCPPVDAPAALTLRHRGAGNPVVTAGDASLQPQVVDIAVVGVRLCDRGREEMVAMAQALSAAASGERAIEPAADSASSKAICAKGDVVFEPKDDKVDTVAEGAQGAGPAVCCSLEAVDVRLEAEAAGQLWRCALPSIRLRSELRSLDDLWACVLWEAAPVVRGMGEPLWEPAEDDPAARPYTDEVDASSASPSEGKEDEQKLEPPQASQQWAIGQRKRDDESGAAHSSWDPTADCIAALLNTERAAREFDHARAAELARRLEDMLQDVRAWEAQAAAAIAETGCGLALDAATPVVQQSSPARVADQAQDVPSPRSLSTKAKTLAAGEDITDELRHLLPIEGELPDSPGGDGSAGAVAAAAARVALGVPGCNGPALVPQPEGPVDVSMSTVMFELEAGKKAWHSIGGLGRGDVLLWAIEEMEAKTVDVNVVVRSRSRLHAARRLRETVRTDGRPLRDSFSVSETDFGDEHLPLSLDIQFDNGFAWMAEKRVRLTLWRLTPGASSSASSP